jgi:hypothetical protein
MTGQTLAVLGVVVLLGLYGLARGVGRRARSAAARAAFEGSERVSVLGRGLTLGAFIVGGQWLTITYAAHNVTLLWTVLGLPAAVTGLAVARVFTVAGAPRSRRGGGRR